jgi:DNA gyrase/topoisomerase IV subunit A
VWLSCGIVSGRAARPCEAEDRDRAREALMAEYDWDHVGATAVLDLRLQHVTRGDRQRIAEELNEIRERLKTLPRQGG